MNRPFGVGPRQGWGLPVRSLPSRWQLPLVAAVFVPFIVWVLLHSDGGEALSARVLSTTSTIAASTTTTDQSVDGDGSGSSSAVAPAAIAQAKQVAASFIVAYGTDNADESGDDRLKRLAPFLTPRLLAEFGQSSSGAYGKAQDAQVQRGASTTIDSVTTEQSYPSQITLSVVADRVTTVAGVAGAAELRAYSLQLVPSTSGWLVDRMAV